MGCCTQVLPSDCASALLHAIHMEPWQRHPSVHRDAFQRLVLQRVSESRVVACLVQYMELETEGIQVCGRMRWGDKHQQLRAA